MGCSYPSPSRLPSCLPTHSVSWCGLRALHGAGCPGAMGCLRASACAPVCAQCSHSSAHTPVLVHQCSHPSAHTPALMHQCSHSSAHTPVLTHQCSHSMLTLHAHTPVLVHQRSHSRAHTPALIPQCSHPSAHAPALTLHAHTPVLTLQCSCSSACFSIHTPAQEKDKSPEASESVSSVGAQ